MNSKKTFFNWSTGKDSSLALYHLLKDDQFSVEHMITTVNSHYDRVSMHGLRRSLMKKQLEAIGLPYSAIELPESPSMEEYENIMKLEISRLTELGFSHSAFGDIFLEDLRDFRDKQLAKVGLTGVYPLWKRDTSELIAEFIDLGFKAITVCTNRKLLGDDFTGRIIDKDFIKELPKNVDQCGENGEFHTFCFDGPIFSKPVDFEIGKVEHRTYPNPEDVKINHEFSFQDLLPKSHC